MIEFVVDVTPSLNKYLLWHWRRRHKYKTSLAWLVRARVGRQMPTKPYEKATITIERFSAGTLDHDNFAGGCKPLIDCLQAKAGGIGIIVDDTPERIKVHYKQTKCKPGRGRTVVKVKEGIDE